MRTIGHVRLGGDWWFFLVGLYLLVGSFPAWSQSSAGKLDLLLADLHADLLAEWPEQATLLGYPEDEGRWTDWSRSGIQNRRLLFERYLGAVRSIPEAGLPEGALLNRRLCERALLKWLEQLSFDPYYFRLNPLTGAHLETFNVIRAMRAGDSEDYQRILERLEQLPRLVAETIRLSDEGLSRGWKPPRESLQQVLGQIDGQITRTAEESPLLRAFRSFPNTIPAAEQEKLRSRAFSSYREKFLPAWQRLREYVAGRALDRSRDSLGLYGLPNGGALYASMIARHSSVPWTARQLHEFGMEEVRRIRNDLRRWQQKQQIPGNAEQLVRRMRADRRFQFRNDKQVLSDAEKFTGLIENQLPRLFAYVPKAPLAIRAMPPQLPTSVPSLYRPGSPQSRAPSYVFLRVAPPQTLRKYDLPVILLHEGWPGHHLQVSLQAESESVHPFRAFYPVDEFSEGWAHYAESLGSELEVYQDAYAEYGRLQAELLRAARLVADTGINAFGWNRERCNVFFRETLGLEPAGEIDRYISMPGQALAYKLGENRLRRLRQRASEELAAEFDIRKFHRVLLEDGMLPLDILEEKVQRWMDRLESAPPETPSQPESVR